MTSTSLIGASAGILTIFNMMPQFIKAIRTKHTKDLAKATFIISSISAFLWVIYGLMKDDFAIAGSNMLVFFLVFSILIMKIRFG